ncbi:MAG TPA: serine/threonine-protein kinase, partial [Aggregatilineales bacterium]|nr:serine/threonine-protein kinase [Aggregatilineales bacterium]
MSDDALNGATIDLRYDVLGKLGAGSTGVVYRALDRLTGRFVALKKVKMAAGQTSPANPNQRLSLAHEFQALATLRHPSIVTVFDYGFDADDIPYLIMELLENAGTIRQVGQNQPLETRVSLLIQLLQALAYLHRRGIVHRDLKPGNVLVASGQVKMLDLGLAAARGQSIGSVGTLRYMAPEVLIGHPADVSTDLYGVGMIAYELFADHYLFDSADDADATILDPRQLVDRIMTIPPDALTAGLDPPIATILNRLLAKNPADRYTGAGQVIDALNELLDQPLPYETDVTRESFLQASQFIGRDSELAVLSEALAQAASGKGNVWLIRGESGVGKSRLVEELRVQALAQGMLVLRGQAIDEGRQPYQVWRDVLRRLCLQPSLTALEASVLKSVVPDIGVLVRRALPDAPTLDPQAAQERFVSVVEAILEHQTRPILIVLEDLQWSGSEGLALLGRLCRTVNGRRILIVGNYRDDERADLSHEVPAAHTLKLNRLTEADIVKLSESMLGAAGQKPNIVSLLQRETE